MYNKKPCLAIASESSMGGSQSVCNESYVCPTMANFLTEIVVALEDFAVRTQSSLHLRVKKHHNPNNKIGNF